MQEKKYYLYFAYGSNMVTQQMRERCPDSSKFEIAHLDDHQLVSTVLSLYWGGGVFSLTEKTGSVVEGVLYLISENDLASLDKYEGHPRQYARKSVEVRKRNGDKNMAYVYISQKTEEIPISESYLFECAEAAKEHGISLLFSK